MSSIQKTKVVSLPVRKRMLELWLSGETFTAIANCTGVTSKTVSNILSKFIQRGHLLPLKPGGKERHIATQPVVEYIEYQKISKPSITALEIQVALVNDGICNLENLPSRSTISDVLRKDLNFTYKKLKVVPQESLTEENQLKLLHHAMFMSQVDPSRVHFFDECSVKRTTGNRVYGHAERGRRAVEVKRYASDCNYTINLLQSRFGITHFNLLEGASNGLEMLQFFHESMQVVDEVYGNPVLAQGDIVVMDNCRFHHGHFAEAELRRILGQRDITLIFQPPYSPELNTCEFSFSVIKSFLRRHEYFAVNFTELAIIRALEVITPDMCRRFFMHCGFLV
ncbi:uncharacterized protein LOC114529512 [Dendronephthya gigantea]|uniref:uncharacterized protein LOC114529512 n=1 Tax=Dendronephthya gigantea TaxID=151771 RepID=UPI00106A99FA|nr:uncharacterized protein LOC114529512 [Dendronephthya gigantea]